MLGTTSVQRRTNVGNTGRDRLRQAANMVLAVAQVAAIGISAVRGFGAERSVAEPPVVPALYTFSVWFVIYAGALAYAVYQALPAQRSNVLLRRIGWWTAAAFLATTLWAVAQTLGGEWLTVPIMFAMFAALLGAQITFITQRAPRTQAERWLVVVPLSIFLGYVTVATIANTASILTQSNITNFLGIPPTAWAVAMLVVAGAVVSFVTSVSRGNVAYALTVIWALVGIIVANVQDKPNTPVAITAGSMAALIAIVLLRARWARRS